MRPRGRASQTDWPTLLAQPGKLLRGQIGHRQLASPDGGPQLPDLTPFLEDLSTRSSRPSNATQCLTRTWRCQGSQALGRSESAFRCATGISDSQRASGAFASTDNVIQRLRASPPAKCAPRASRVLMLAAGMLHAACNHIRIYAALAVQRRGRSRRNPLQTD